MPLTAMVLDHPFGYALVKQYRSDAGGWPVGNRRTARERLNASAVEMAEAKARELNDAERASAAA